ncbi:MAG: phosphoribosylamine--glycine ligase [Firmicutes bacterium]|nr:phosphoribosylamine--glycine ligase [Bacillota bacterium]
MKKDILIIGGGGREHAICWALSKSKSAGRLHAIPGNAGIAELAECHAEIGATDSAAIVAFAKAYKIGLVIVAPDDPLAAGVVDALEAAGIRAFGPTRAAAEIESSKAFSKSLMKKYGIPTAGFEVFCDMAAVSKFLRGAAYPLVVKADGLALGKGVIICQNREEAEDAARSMMAGRFGASGKTVVVEEFLQGYEVSVLAFTDGETLVPMVTAQDHKRVFDGDQGPNTGGMGTFSPSRRFDAGLMKKAYDTIFMPTVSAMKAEGRRFKGVLFFGLMVNGDDIKVLEYNARFGDPETQSVLPRLKTDLLEIFEAVIDGRLSQVKVEFDECAAVTVMLASAGYPGDCKKGFPITVSKLDENIILFHSGTKTRDDGTLVTNGGRVLGVTAVADTLEQAKEDAYRNVRRVHFEGMHYRTDIS